MASDTEQVQQVITWIAQGNPLPIVRESIVGNFADTDADTLIELANLEIERQGGWDVVAAKFIYGEQIKSCEFADAARTLKDIERLTKARQKPNQEPDQTPAPPKTVLIDPKRATSDINLYERAIRNGWPIAPETMAQIPDVLTSVMSTGDARSKIAAIRCLITMHGQNQKSRPAPTKKVRHIHKMEPVTEHNLDDRKRNLIERLDSLGKDSPGSPAD